MLRKIRDRIRKRRFHRKLEVSKAGAWFLVLTVVLGVVALMTGNNVIYLIESFLLAALIVSGLVSEKAISSLEVRFIRGQSRVGERSPDWIEITNTTRQAFYCIELGEWSQGRFQLLTYIPMIRAHETIRLRSEQDFSRRGRHTWEGFALSTSAPFAFARKTKVIWQAGERIVWPSRSRARGTFDAEEGARGTRRMPAIEVVEGEIRPYLPDDDARHIVARLSLKGTGAFVRNRRQQMGGNESVLDLRSLDEASLEKEIRAIVHSLEKSSDPQLKIIQVSGSDRYRGLRAVMNALALIEITPPKNESRSA